jgi:hypothetical protein
MSKSLHEINKTNPTESASCFICAGVNTFKRRNQIQDFPGFLSESLGCATRFTRLTVFVSIHAARIIFARAAQRTVS